MTLFVPGRLEIFGKHTDYAGGRSLLAAVPRGFTVTAQRAAAGIIVTDENTGEAAVFDAKGNGPGNGWRRYARTVIRRLSANFPDRDLSSRITFRSDLPPASGLSSSSALVIAIAESLVWSADLEDSEAWRAAIVTPEDRAAYFGCIENGATFGPLAGERGVGTHGGSEDHAAIILSRAGYLLQCSFNPLRAERRVRMPDGWTFVVATSGVIASKTGDAMERYNRLADPAAMTGGRLEQFNAENARVTAAAVAFDRGAVADLGPLAAASQDDAERWLGNQVPETRDLAAIAREHGAAAASAFGAGWGGSVWALVQTTRAASFLDAWLAAYRSRHPALPSSGFLSPPGAGVIRL